MTNFTNQISGIAMLALAALPVAALATGAHAAPTVVKVADLNLFSAEGVAAFQLRAGAAGRTFCRDERSLVAQESCRAGVKAELEDKFAMARSAQLAAKTQNFAAR